MSDAATGSWATPTAEPIDSLALVDRAREALRMAHTLADIGGVMEIAERARRYAKAAKLGLDAENHAAALRLEAEWRAGGMLAEGPKQGPGDFRKRGEIHSVPIPPSQADLGVTKQQAKDWQTVAKVPEPKFRQYVERVKEARRPLTTAGLVQFAKQITRGEHAKQIAAEPPPLPTGPFRVIVADPPWTYASRSTDQTHRARNPYPDMTLDEICAMPVADLAAEDCILWLWTTNAHMREAFDVLDAWGFTHKTILTWVKDRMGTGDWLRGRTEHCLVAVRGRPTVLLTNQTTVLHGPLREHSRKPDEFYALVESLCPGSKVELFARQARDGWVAHGSEVAA